VMAMATLINVTRFGDKFRPYNKNLPKAFTLIASSISVPATPLCGRALAPLRLVRPRRFVAASFDAGFYDGW